MAKSKGIAHETYEQNQRYAAIVKSMELRGIDREFGIDEIVAANATIHIEQMDETWFYIGIQTKDEYLQLGLGSDTGRAKVSLYAYGHSSELTEPSP